MLQDCYSFAWLLVCNPAPPTQEVRKLSVYFLKLARNLSSIELSNETVRGILKVRFGFLTACVTCVSEGTRGALKENKGTYKCASGDLGKGLKNETYIYICLIRHFRLHLIVKFIHKVKFFLWRLGLLVTSEMAVYFPCSLVRSCRHESFK